MCVKYRMWRPLHIAIKVKADFNFSPQTPSLQPKFVAIPPVILINNIEEKENATFMVKSKWHPQILVTIFGSHALCLNSFVNAKYNKIARAVSTFSKRKPPQMK